MIARKRATRIISKQNDHDYQKSDVSFDNIDPGFAASARCIFVYKNHLGPHSARTWESTRNSAFL
jgi:hypothetical protein